MGRETESGSNETSDEGLGYESTRGRGGGRRQTAATLLYKQLRRESSRSRFEARNKKAASDRTRPAAKLAVPG